MVSQHCCLLTNWWLFSILINKMFLSKSENQAVYFCSVPVNKKDLATDVVLVSYFPAWINIGLPFVLFRRLLGIITKKDILRHMAQTANQDPASIMFN